MSLAVLFSSFLFSQQENSVTTITIKNARETNYKKNESGEDCIILEGSVKLIVQKNDSESEISAEKVTYNRTTEMLFAQGDVTVSTKDSSSGSETTSADSLLLNTSTLEGVFDGGKVIQTQSDALNLPSGSTLVVFSNLFGKTGSNVITFKNSSLTFCDDDIPHWHIDATRTWLLPGGEFAFFNALLYVGVVPVMYFPAFYYPKDELVFNPVFSYSPRAGYSFQTTTYVIGRKPLSAPSSSEDLTSASSSSSSSSTESSSADSLKDLYNFMKPSSLKEQVQEGIVLHNLDSDYNGNTSDYLKIMGDWYSNLGFHVGAQGEFSPSATYLTSLKFNLNLGFSKTVFYNSDGNYYPFSSLGTSYNDSSDFLGLKLPFRFAAGIDLTLSKPFSLSLSFPVYSDPYFSYDFIKNRYETMEWISYILDNLNGNKKTQGTVTEVSNYEWKLSASASPSLPSSVKPYISSLSFKSDSTVNINSKDATFSSDSSYIKFNGTNYETEWKNYTPLKRFYYPSSVTPASAELSFGGTIFSYPKTSSSNSSVKNNFVSDLNKPNLYEQENGGAENASANDGEMSFGGASENDGDEILSKNDADGTLKNSAAEKSFDSENSSESENQDKRNSLFDVSGFSKPELSYSVPNVKIAGGFSYKLSYSVKGSFTNQFAYASENLHLPSDFNWNNYRSYLYILKTPITLTSSAAYGDSFLSLVNNISYSPAFQSHPYISEKPESEGGNKPETIASLRLTDYKAESQDITNSNTLTLKPFLYYSLFSDSSVTWNTAVKLYKRTFTGTADEPDWKNEFADFTDENFVTANTLSVVIAASELEKKLKQSLTLSAVMRPLLMQYTASFALTFPYVTFSAGSGIKETSKEDLPYDEKWKKNPFTQSLNVNLFDSNISFTENYSYNLEDKYHESLKLSLSAFKMLQVVYQQSYAYGYDFDKSSGWTVKSEKEFIPYSLSFSFAPQKKTYYRWFNRVSFAPSLNMSLVADLRRATDSYFEFSPSLNFKIHEFLEVSFSSTSRNSVLYWYFHNEEGDLYSEWGGFPGNIVKDLIDSFDFAHEKKRENSGFKLKSLNLTASHDLHDWKMNMQLKITPRLVTENDKKRYDFNPYFTIGIVWNPMESIKTNITDEYGEWKIE